MLKSLLIMPRLNFSHSNTGKVLRKNNYINTYILYINTYALY